MLRASALVILSFSACSLIAAQDDVITGTDVAEDFRGGEGMDTMIGGTGNDTLIGQDGDDTLKGGPGDDRMAGGPGVDIIRGDADEDIVAGGADNDDMQGNAGDDFMIGGPGDDLLLGGPGNDTMLAGVGNDTLSAEGGRDVFYGGPGDDILQGQVGSDTCVLQPSDDDCVSVNLGESCEINTCLPFAVPVVRDDLPVEAVGPSILLPSVEASDCTDLGEDVVARVFAASFEAGDGDELGVTISDIQGDFEGASVTFSTTSCCLSTCETVFPIEDSDDDDDDDDADDVQFNIPIDDTEAGNVYIFVTYPRTNKDLTFSIDTGIAIAPAVAKQPASLRRRALKPNRATAQTKIGAPVIKTIPTKPKVVTAPKAKKSEPKKDVFVSHNKKQTALIEKICSNLNATCDANLAKRFQAAVRLQKVNVKRSKTQIKKAPYVTRVAPTFTPEVAAGVKIAEEAEFKMPVATGPNGPIFVGGAGDDVLRGRGGNDRMAGQNGDDTMIGAADSDLLLGGNGEDLLIAGPGNDIVQGNAGEDDARGGPGNDTMIGGPGDDTLRGGADNDIMAGAVGNDTLRGGMGNDILDGGEGNDEFFGGMENDVMFGDDGRDQCRLQPDDAYIINFNSTCDNDLCEPFTETLASDGTPQSGEVFVATQPSVRFECANMADDITVEGSQVFLIDTSGFTPPVAVTLSVSSATFEGSIALSDSCCGQTCVGDIEPITTGAATLTTVFPTNPETVYAYVTSFNQTMGTFDVSASEATPTVDEIPL